MSSNVTRFFTLEGCFNFRDAGGYATTDGGRVRWRRLFRAGGPYGLTERDVVAVERLAISTVIDLRTDDEAERGRYAARAMHHLPMTDVLPTDAELESWTDPLVVGERYFEMASGARRMIADALTVLADPAALPVLMHCSAGKDRTGILVAIVLGLLHVGDDDIVGDYALSAPAMRDLLAWLERTAPDAREQVVRKAPAILAAEPEAMRHFIARLRDEHGSFEGYAEAIGVESVVPYLRDALVE
jgi:protein tyrosine/serine phosphatase